MTVEVLPMAEEVKDSLGPADLYIFYAVAGAFWLLVAGVVVFGLWLEVELYFRFRKTNLPPAITALTLPVWFAFFAGARVGYDRLFNQIDTSDRLEIRKPIQFSDVFDGAAICNLLVKIIVVPFVVVVLLAFGLLLLGAAVESISGR